LALDVNGLTTETVVDSAADYVVLYDGSAAAHRKVLVTDLVVSVSAATQAEMEAASSTSVYVSPGTQQYHPSAAKVWVVFDASTATILASYNVSSITDNGTGDFTINYTTATSSTNYAFVGIAADATSSTTSMLYCRPRATGDILTGSIRVNVGYTNSSGGALVDYPYVSVAIFGDL
jgi:hypothetical protein